MKRRSILLPLKRRHTTGMYPEQWALLEKGDIIRGAKPNGAMRIIERVSKDEWGGTTFIELEKIRPSRFPSRTTLYCRSDASQFVPLRVKNERIWNYTFEVVQRKRLRLFERRHRELADAHIKKALRYLQPYAKTAPYPSGKEGPRVRRRGEL